MTALDRLRYELIDPNNQDIPIESIKDLLGDLLNVVESEMSNGGTQPITREQLHSPSVVTVDGNQGGAALLWEKLDGDDLLDLTDPSSPVVIEGGVYAVSIGAVPSNSLPVGASYSLRLYMDAGGDSAQVIQDSPPSVAMQDRPVTEASLTFYVPVGGTLLAFLINQDNSAHDFTLVNTYVQRLSGPDTP